MGSLSGPTTGWTMGWLAAGFLALQPFLHRVLGAMLLALLVVTCGGLLAALVALGRSAFAATGRHGPVPGALGLLALAPLCLAFAAGAGLVTGALLGAAVPALGDSGPAAPLPPWCGWLRRGLVVLPSLLAPAAVVLGLAALRRPGLDRVAGPPRAEAGDTGFAPVERPGRQGPPPRPRPRPRPGPLRHVRHARRVRRSGVAGGL